MTASPTSVTEVSDGLREAGYLPGESTALVSFLAAKLGKPVLVEGPAGVGMTTSIACSRRWRISLTSSRLTLSATREPLRISLARLRRDRASRPRR